MIDTINHNKYNDIISYNLAESSRTSRKMLNLFWQIVVALAAMLLPNIGGFVNAYVTQPNIDSWYKYLNRPPFSPPNWLFAPVWVILYCAIGLASFLVWRSAYVPQSKVSRRAFWWAISVYALQIVTNWVWTPVFFGSHELMAVSIGIIITS